MMDVTGPVPLDFSSPEMVAMSLLFLTTLLGPLFYNQAATWIHLMLK